MPRLFALFAAMLPLRAPAAAVPVLLREAEQAAALQRPLHGLYLEARAGLGYTLVDRGKIAADPAFPTLAGSPEMLGGSTMVDAALGYELLDNVALQLSGGFNLLAGRRDDRVRGLSLGYGGLGVRLALPATERLLLTLTPSVLYVHASTQVDPAHSGLGAMLAVGLDYFVHVRHLSLGVDVGAMMATAPLRLVLDAAPHVRYTF